MFSDPASRPALAHPAATGAPLRVGMIGIGTVGLGTWRVLQRKDGRALVQFEPETGRTHQIRVHAAEGLGTPIVGDPVYGKAGEPMLLHAWRLIVPREGKPPIEAEAPLPERFQGFALDAAA